MSTTLKLDIDPKLPPLRELVKQSLQAYFCNLGDSTPANLYDLVLQEMELPLLQLVMHVASGNQSRAAQMLGISRGTLRKKLKLYKLSD